MENTNIEHDFKECNNNDDLQMVVLKKAISADSQSEGTSGIQKTNDGNESEMTKEQIEAALAGALASVNEKRNQDLSLVAEINQHFLSKVEMWRVMLEKYVVTMHAARTKELEAEVAKIKDCHEKISTMQSELEQCKDSLSFLCRDI